jgi:hypothetical protein
MNADPNRVAETAGRLAFRQVVSSDDLPGLIDIARQYHSESRYAGIPFSEGKFLKALARSVEDKNAVSIVADLNGVAVGLMGANIGDYFMGTGARIATNYIFYVSPVIRGSLLGGRAAVKLMQLFSHWAKINGATEINIHAVSGIQPERTDRFLRSCGFAQYGGNYAKQV